MTASTATSTSITATTTRGAGSPPVPTPHISAAPVPSSSQPAVETILDFSGWDWRREGISVRLGYHPRRCCHWGVYDFHTKSVWVGPSAFRDPERLRYVALHELAHAWQWASGRLAEIEADLRRWPLGGVRPLEAAADCLAKRWGATRSRYWQCPADAEALVARRFAGSWD